MRIAVTGSHGLIARHLIPALQAGGHRVLRVVRGSAAAGELSWDPDRGILDDTRLAGVDAVVHLAGAAVAGRRWNPQYRQQILDSRVKGTDLLARRLAVLDPPPAVLVSASAVGFYGNRGDEWLDEDSPPGSGFLAEVCRHWEAAATPAAEAGIRTVLLRTGIVLARDGGALSPQLPLFRLGLGPRLGSGRQWTSWIGIDDEVGGILHALSVSELSGPVNLVAPSPVTNATFTRTVAQVLHRPAVLAVPAVALRAALGEEMANETLLSDQRVRPTRLSATGYRFRHPSLEPALRAVLGR